MLAFTATLTALLALLSLGLAEEYKQYKGYREKESPSYKKDNSNGAYVYHGKYSGKCGHDGLYYRDDRSFVFCSNGNSYIQPCAPGSRNSAFGTYSYGGKYDYRDFCDVNLVDEGYSAKRAVYAHNAKRRQAKEYDYVYGRRNFGYGLDYGYLGRNFRYGRHHDNGY